MNETEILAELKQITFARDEMAKEWGWLANDYLAEMLRRARDVKPPHPKQSYREVLTATLDFLETELPRMKRATISDRIRVMGYFTRERAEKIPDAGYNQLRACIASIPGTNDIDRIETEERVAWAIANNWPTDGEIREHFGNGNRSQNVIMAAVKACRRVTELTEADEDFVRICALVANYHVGEDGRWCKDDAVQSELLEAE